MRGPPRKRRTSGSQFGAGGRGDELCGGRAPVSLRDDSHGYRSAGAPDAPGAARVKGSGRLEFVGHDRAARRLVTSRGDRLLDRKRGDRRGYATAAGQQAAYPGGAVDARTRGGEIHSNEAHNARARRGCPESWATGSTGWEARTGGTGVRGRDDSGSGIWRGPPGGRPVTGQGGAGDAR